MAVRYVVRVLTLNRGDMYFSECSPAKLDFSLQMAKRFMTEADARVCILSSLKNRNCHIEAVKA